MLIVTWTYGSFAAVFKAGDLRGEAAAACIADGHA
jgi:hypothetical protein